MRICVVGILVLICTIFPIRDRASLGEEPPAVATIPKFDFPEAAAKYAVQVLGSSKDCELGQVDRLKWTNPIRGTAAGSVFLWTQGGVPQAACCMYAYRPEAEYFVDHELVSLTTDGIEARYDGQSVWRTEKPGIAWSPVPNAPPPVSNRSGRLIQMRKMATTITGYIGTPTTQRQELRLLPQPIYRFPDMPEFDGAAFAYVETTDPEVLLLMRVKLQSQKPIWEFAAARMTIVHTFLTVEDKVVWSVAWWNKDSDPTYLTRGQVPYSVVKE